MEAEPQTATAETGGEVAGAGIDFQALLDGNAPSQPEQSTPAEATPTPESAEPAEDAAKVDEPVETKADEEKPADQTAEDFSDPLPGKLGKLLEAVAKTSPDLARQIRADHEALNGPDGFRGMFKTVDEAREYKNAAPTVEDLKVMSDFAQRYDMVDKQYTNDPQALIRTLAEDRPAFAGVAQAFEPAIRALNDPQLYETTARPFNQNFWQNVMAAVQRDGAPEEVELFKAFEAKYLGGMARLPQAATQGPQQNELEQLKSEKAAFYQQRQEAFFNDAKSAWTGTVNGDIRKHLEEKIGSVIPKDIREDVLAEAVRQSAPAVWKFIDSNPMVKSRLAAVIENGDQSPQHKQAVIDAVLAYAKPQIHSATANVIRQQIARAKAYGGNGNATTTTTAPSRDVGSGSPSVGNAPGAPKGFPAGWNVMDQETRSKYINWRAMGDDAEEIVITAHQSGDWSKVVLKGK